MFNLFQRTNSDPCRRFREAIGLRFDGKLTDKQLKVLEKHLFRCVPCREVESLELARRQVLGVHTGMLSTEQTEAFDNNILHALNTISDPQRNPVADFLTQFAGGGLIAASITMFCLLWSLNPQGDLPNKGNSLPASKLSARNEPPVSLEILLGTPTPRAVLLWNTPNNQKQSAENSENPTKQKVKQQEQKPSQKQNRSSRPTTSLQSDDRDSWKG